MAKSLAMRNSAISRKDSGLQDLQEVLKETLRTIVKKRTVASEVTAGVKEAALIFTELLTHCKTWKDAQRRLAHAERKDRESLIGKIQRREKIIKEASRPSTPKERETSQKQESRKIESPPRGTEECVSRQT